MCNKIQMLTKQHTASVLGGSAEDKTEKTKNKLIWGWQGRHHIEATRVLLAVKRLMFTI
jgi:hypothetical protein